MKENAMVYCRTPNKEFGWLMLKIPNLQYGLLEIFHFFLTLPKSVFIKVNKSYPQCNEGGIPWLDLLGNLLGKHQQSTIHPPNDCMAGRTLHSYIPAVTLPEPGPRLGQAVPPGPVPHHSGCWRRTPWYAGAQ